MTLASTPPLIDYVEDGVTLVHAIPFQFQLGTEIVCTRIAADGTPTSLIYGVDFTVTGGAGSTGTLTKTSAGVAGTVFRIQRVTQETQATNFTSGQAFPAENVEAALDRDMAVAQETATALSLLRKQTIVGTAADSIPALPAAPSRISKFMRWALDGKSVLLLSATDLAAALVTPLVTLLGAAFKGDPGSPGEGYATRAAMATAINAAAAHDDFYLTEEGRQGKFVFHTAASFAFAFYGLGVPLTTMVAADTGQGLFVAAQKDATGASGAAVRQFDGEVWWHWWGAVQGRAAGANASANNTAWTGMMATLAAMRWNATASQYAGLTPVRIGPGSWEASAALEIKDGAVKIEGCGSGHGTSTTAASATVIKCYNTTGFLFQDNNTSGTGTKDGTNHYGGSRSSISNLTLEGTFAGTEAEYHGVHSKCVIYLTNVQARNFAGDGFHLWGDSTGSAGGAVDCSRLVDCEVWGCRRPIATFGADANCIQVIGGIYNANRDSIIDGCGLGSWYAEVETSGNGSTASNDGVNIPATTVSSGGNRFQVRWGMETAASTNAPPATATNDANWIYLFAGGAGNGFPAWFSGMLLRSGGCFVNTGLTAASVYSSCYAEQNQGKAQLLECVFVGGGHIATFGWVDQTDPRAGHCPAMVATKDGTPILSPGLQVVSGSATVKIGSGASALTNPSNVLVEFNHPLLSDVNGSQLMVDGAAGDILLTNGRITTSSKYVCRWTGPASTSTFADGLTHSWSWFIPRLILPSSFGGAHTTGKPVFRAATSSATYVAATGGTTVDAQARASQAQLAADFADLKTKLQAAGLMS